MPEGTVPWEGDDLFTSGLKVVEKWTGLTAYVRPRFNFTLLFVAAKKLGALEM